MNKKAKILIASFLTLMSGMVYSQDISRLDRLYDDFFSNRITLEISYVIEVSSSEIAGEGVVSFQDDAYHMSGNGIEVWCDGKDVWMVDPEAKEVYIEPVDGGQDAYVQNPALLFAGLKDNFKVQRVHEDGRYDLLPVVVCGIDECSVLIKRDGDLSQGTFLMSDGHKIRVDVRSIERAEKTDISSYRPAVRFDSSWMVTDLR